MTDNHNSNNPEKEITQEQTIQEQVKEYISTLNDREKMVLEIAKEHLQSSFCIERSVGFVKWKNSKK